jgi:UDP-N-acetyl-D-glucosamine dehydrogenase
VGDLRESPGIEIIDLLRRRGAHADYSDPYIAETLPMRKYDLDMRSVELTPGTLERYDCVLLATDHDAFDYEAILDSARLVIDTRGRYRGEHTRVVHA